MTTFNPFFRAQAFQVEPHRARIALCHCGNVAWRDITTEKFNDDIGDIASRKHALLIAPVAHRHTGKPLYFGVERDVRTNPLKALQVVYPQGYGNFMFARKLPRQSPAHTDIAEIIDDM